MKITPEYGYRLLKNNERPHLKNGDKYLSAAEQRWVKTGHKGEWTVSEGVGCGVLAYERPIKLCVTRPKNASELEAFISSCDELLDEDWSYESGTLYHRLLYKRGSKVYFVSVLDEEVAVFSEMNEQDRSNRCFGIAPSGKWRFA